MPDVAGPHAVAVEGRVDYVVLPVTFGLAAGTMRLADGRLSYTRKRKGRVVFDAPVDEFHSFARSSWGSGFHLWHGATRHRFIVYEPVLPFELGPGVAMDVVEDLEQFARSRRQLTASRSEVDRWHGALVPVIARTPPAGVTVRPPMSNARYLTTAILGSILVALVIAAVVTALVFAGG